MELNKPIIASLLQFVATLDLIGTALLTFIGITRGIDTERPESAAIGVLTSAGIFFAGVIIALFLIALAELVKNSAYTVQLLQGQGSSENESPAISEKPTAKAMPPIERAIMDSKMLIRENPNLDGPRLKELAQALALKHFPDSVYEQVDYRDELLRKYRQSSGN